MFVLVLHATKGHTAVLFGATGAVGSEVLRSLLMNHATFWSDLIIVGRRKVDLQGRGSNMNITQVVIPDLTKMDQHNQLLETKADACIIAIGAGTPFKDTLRDWHAVDVEIPGAAGRLCKTMDARYVSLLSAVDSDADSEPFPEEELSAKDEMGWWGMLVRYARMKGLGEQIVASSGIPHVTLFQPSNIVTEYTRYGWFDWALFRVLPYLDPLMPKKYHSVPVRLLGMAMVGDAIETISNRSNSEDRTIYESGSAVARRTYEDFVRVSGKQYEAAKEEEEQRTVDASSTEEL